MKKYFKYKKSDSVFTKVNSEFKIRLILLIVLSTSLFSCESFVEVDLPNTQISSPTVFENTGTATAALVYIYARLRDNVLFHGQTSSMSVALGHYSDELNSSTSSLYYNNTITPQDVTNLSIWTASYNLIYASNALIEGVNNSTNIPQNDKDQLIGEALFARSLIHFYLTNLFGDIPFIETTNFEENTQASKIQVSEIYEKIILDLLTAKGLLGDAYLTSERIRPNKGAVSALLSRVYLYAEEWANAEYESTELINNTSLYNWESDIAKVFLIESPSTIWQFKPLADGNNTREANSFIFVSGPPSFTSITSALISAFEPGDDRLTNWVGSVTDGIDTWFHPFKYKENSDTGTSVEYSKQFRLAEQFLIRAEARAQLGNISGAQADINMIRTRAGLANTSAATTTALLDAILQERQVELFTEHGHRFFDLKRMGKADEVLSLVKPGWNATDILFPIPEEEILVNSNLLPQNPGYN